MTLVTILFIIPIPPTSRASTSALCHRIEDRLGLDRGSVNGQMIFEKIEQDDQVYIEELDYMIDKLAVGISKWPISTIQAQKS